MEIKNDRIDAPLTTPKIKKFFESVWADAKCRVCGRDSWKIGGDNSLIARLRLFDGRSADKGYSLPAVWFSCAHCGAVEFVAAQAIKRFHEDPEQFSQK